MITKGSTSATPNSGSSQVAQYFFFPLFEAIHQQERLCLGGGLLSIAGLLACGEVYKHI